MTLTIETTKLTETAGAEILGVDVDRLLREAELGAFTRDALETRHTSRNNAIHSTSQQVHRILRDGFSPQRRGLLRYEWVRFSS